MVALGDQCFKFWFLFFIFAGMGRHNIDHGPTRTDILSVSLYGRSIQNFCLSLEMSEISVVRRMSSHRFKLRGVVEVPRVLCRPWVGLHGADDAGAAAAPDPLHDPHAVRASRFD